ncbi:MAG: GntR family transcriptional regulator [Planctomycetaceae bacterium]|jgi:DNA-binding GntR family transcriptional regulator|nr:GntR family transcriptional regulator [Planctomycetaceae bacterium]
MQTISQSKHEPPKKGSKNETSSLKSQAYEYIHAKLLCQEWTSGHAISLREIANETGIGFTPVREAINQLVSEGLLESHPQRGTFVTRITREDLADLYDVREALECHALQKAIDLGIDCDFDTLRNCNESLRNVLEVAVAEKELSKLDELRASWSNSDMTFHKTLLLLSGNRLAIRLVQELRDKTRIFGHRNSLDPKNLEVILNDHDRIIAALEEKNADLACAEMKKHLRRGCGIALASYDRKRLLSATTQ